MLQDNRTESFVANVFFHLSSGTASTKKITQTIMTKFRFVGNTGKLLPLMVLHGHFASIKITSKIVKNHCSKCSSVKSIFYSLCWICSGPVIKQLTFFCSYTCHDLKNVSSYDYSVVMYLTLTWLLGSQHLYCGLRIYSNIILIQGLVSVPRFNFSMFHHLYLLWMDLVCESAFFHILIK